MSPFDRVIAVAQVMMLVLWEALGWVAFGWSPWAILAYWFVGIWSFNVLVATAVRTFYKLTSPGAVLREATEVDVPDIDITEDDEVG